MPRKRKVHAATYITLLDFATPAQRPLWIESKERWGCSTLCSRRAYKGKNTYGPDNHGPDSKTLVANRACRVTCKVCARNIKLYIDYYKLQKEAYAKWQPIHPVI